MQNLPMREADQLALADLAAELTVLVDRMNDDWHRCGKVMVETAEQVHRLRDAAEHLFGEKG